MRTRATIRDPRRPAVVLLLLLLPLALLAACSVGDSKSADQSAAGDVGGTWSPDQLTDVTGVPVATLRSAIGQRLAAPRPKGVGEEAWQHTQHLYRRFGQTPLWLVSDGLAKDRAGALTTAVLKASDDGLRIDDYPMAELTNTLVALRRTPKPTAEQYADADVVLTATYAAIGEDYLTGQVSPRSVAQSWHIDPQDENVDSALVRTLSKLPLDQSIAAMRPQDDEYAGLQKQMLRFRDIVAKGGW